MNEPTNPAERGETNHELSAMQCPLPHAQKHVITMAHGGGGSVMHQLINEHLLPSLNHTGTNGDHISGQHDATVLEIGATRIAMTTDSFVVQPIWFPGGDIGSLAIHGTVNDLAMAGAIPQYISVGLILEAGFPIDELDKLMQSMGRAAAACGVHIVTGDTKVVERGKGDKIYINTAGIGVVPDNLDIHPRHIRDGDCLIVSGDIARHGMAVMALREELEFETTITSDSASIASSVRTLCESGVNVRCLRDLTRGGLASALCELAGHTGLTLEIRESEIPVRHDVRSACELLGFDPLYVACEGRFLAVVPERDAQEALNCLRRHARHADEHQDLPATIIGRVRGNATRGEVHAETPLGTKRLITMLSGEQLPRIC
ncbi:MAG: hydrogenase expression/formation protein HypE [Phycisphaerae bacterium]